MSAERTRRDDWSSGPSPIHAAWRHRWLVVGATVVAAILGFGLSLLQPKVYEAHTDLLLRNPRDTGILDGSSAGIANPVRYVRNEANVLESAVVAERAAEILDDGTSPTDIIDNVRADSGRDVDLVTVRATDGSASQAAEIANALATAYGNLKLEEANDNAQQAAAALEQALEALRAEVGRLDAALADDPDSSALQAERDAAVAQLSSASRQIADIETSAALFGSGVEVLEVAAPPSTPIQPRPLRNGVAAAVLGLLAASAFAWWRSERLPVTEDRLDPAPILGAPLLGQVPVHSEAGASAPIPTVSSPDTAAAEAYQYAFSALGFAAEEAGATMLVLTSPGPGDGKTVTTANLAIAAVHDGRRTIVVDADERARGLSELAGEQTLRGLTDLSRDEAKIQECIHEWSQNSVTLRIIPAGSTIDNTAAFFRSPGFRKAMLAIRAEADLTLIDTPPVLSVAETADILAQADGVVLVVNNGTSLRDLEDVRDRLNQTGKPLLGYIYNRAKTPSGRYAYPYN